MGFNRRGALRASYAVIVVAGVMDIAIVPWMQRVPYDKQWRKPAHVIESFLSSAQKKDYVRARTFFSSAQLTNIADWEGSFDTWCSKFAAYSKFELGPSGPSKGGSYWTAVFGVTPDGRREFVASIYAKQIDGVWSLNYALGPWRGSKASQDDASGQPTNTTP
jgi:hypothetical protein